MAKRNKKKNDETLVDIAEKTEQAKDFYGQNQYLILGGILLLCLLVGGWWAYNNLYKKPLQEKAVKEMAEAERMFAIDSFTVALAGKANLGTKGFKQIADEYSSTPAGNLANYYAGVSWMQLGQFDAALEYLNDYNPDGSVVPISYYGVLGDVHSELAYADKENGSMDKASSYYQKAIGHGGNDFLTAYYMKKLGMLYEYQGKLPEAKAMYEDIRTKFPNSPEGRDIDKFIGRLSAN